GPHFERTLGCLDRNHLHAAGENVIAAGGFEISHWAGVLRRSRRSTADQKQNARNQQGVARHLALLSLMESLTVRLEPRHSERGAAAFVSGVEPAASAAIRFANILPRAPAGRSTSRALLLHIRCASRIWKSVPATSGSREISRNADPSVAGRIAAALAN